jgi:hypothetical protein
MKAKVLPFPLSCRRRLVARQAEFYASQPFPAAERNLAHQLELQGKTLSTKGVNPELIAHELHQLETAIRAHVFMALQGRRR